MFRCDVDADVTLCILEERHANDLFSLLTQNVSHLQAELAWLTEEITLSDSKEYIRAGLERFAANNGLRAGIWVNDNLAGIVSLHSVVWADNKASLGYWLGETFLGKGLVTKSCTALIDHAFYEYKLHRLEIQCDVDNFPSRKVAERLGFTQEGILRQSWRTREKYTDLVVYGLLATEWKHS